MTTVHTTDTTTTHAATWMAPEIVDGAPLTIVPAAQDGAVLTGIFVEAAEGDLEARAAALGGAVERVEIPVEPAARRDFLARWSADNALLRRGLPMALLLLPLAACGGGGGGGAAAPGGAAGIVIKGYLSGATVFRDVDRDGVLDANEPRVTTGADGRFTGLGGSTSDPIVAICAANQCTDIGTNAPFVGTLTAPGTATVVTPLMSLVNALLPATTAPTQAQIDAAVTQAKAALGMAANTTNFLTADLAAANPSADTLNALKASVQIGNLIAAVGGGKNGQAIVAQIATAIQPVASGGQDLNLSAALINSATIANLINASNIANMTNANAVAIAALVATQNEDVSDAGNTDAVENAQPKIFSLAQAVAATTLPTDYKIADTAANIEAALAQAQGNATRARLLGADTIVASDTTLALSVTTAQLLFEKIADGKLLSSFDVTDALNGAVNPFTELSLTVLNAARVVTINGDAGNNNITSDGYFGNGVTRGLVLDGKGGDDLLIGSAFNDTLIGGAGNDELTGNSGSDTVDYSYLTSTGVTVVLNSAEVATVNVSATDVDTLTDIENATGGGGADALTGDIVANVLSGLGGDDSLNGDDGADTLIGGAGNDVLSGGADGDTFVFSTSSTLGGSDVVEDFSIADNDRIDFRFGETGELALSGLHGTGAEYAEVAAGEEIGANVGLVVVTSAQTGVLAATAGTAALALGNELLAANNSAFADGDILLLAFSNGTSTFMVRIGDTVNSAGGDSDLAFDSAELLFTLETLSNASELSPSTFIDFAQPV